MYYCPNALRLFLELFIPFPNVVSLLIIQVKRTELNLIKVQMPLTYHINGIGIARH